MCFETKDLNNCVTVLDAVLSLDQLDDNALVCALWFLIF